MAKVPSWATRPFEAFHFQRSDTAKFSRLAKRGLAEAARATAPIEDFGENDLIEAAQEQVANGFALIWEQGVVALWSQLEVLTEDLALAFLQHAFEEGTVESLSTEARETKLTAEAWIQGAPRDRARQLLAELDKKQRFGTRPGSGQLEETLKTVGLDGAVDSEVKRHLLHTSQSRHVLVHRAGEVDERFVTNCPDLNLSVGQRVCITEEMFSRWTQDAERYAAAVAERVVSRLVTTSPSS